MNSNTPNAYEHGQSVTAVSSLPPSVPASVIIQSVPTHSTPTSSQPATILERLKLLESKVADEYAARAKTEFELRDRITHLETQLGTAVYNPALS